MEQNLSKTFDFLRFPLALLVIYLHIAPTYQPWTMPETYLSVSHHIYITINVIVCSIAQISVPCFFLISAYLLCINIEHLTFQVYWTKLKRRFLTLFIPYIFWNIMAWGYFSLIGRVNNPNTLSFIFLNPANFPLWFLKNLFIMNILFPFFYWLGKYGRWIVFLIVIMLYSVLPLISPRYTEVIGNYTLPSFVFFYLGTYFGINKTNVISITTSIKYFIIALGISFFLMKITFNPSFAKSINNATLLLCVFSTFIIVHHIVVKYKVTAIPFLTSATFYIYLSHKVGATYLSKQIFCFMPANSYITQLFTFLVCPLITSSICVISYHLLTRIIPPSTYYLIGAK